MSETNGNQLPPEAGSGFNDGLGPWCDDPMECYFCNYEWVSVHPCAEKLECPKCGRMTKSRWAEDRDEWLKKEMR